jgi:hypothetical protein
MTRIRIAGVMLAAVFVFGAVAVASAATETWFVEHKTTFGTEALGATTKVKTDFTLGFKEGSVEIKCTKLSDTGGSIKEGNSGEATALIFTGCTDVKPSSKCTVESNSGVKGEIVTGAVIATLLSGTKVEFTPKGGGNFTEFKLKGTSCGVAAGKFNVHGQATGTTTKKEEKEKLLTFSTTSGSKLEVGGEGAEFKGSVKLKLASEKIWGAE